MSDDIIVEVGTKVQCSATGANEDFTAGKEYTVKAVGDRTKGSTAVIILDDDNFPCLCLISNVLPCAHAGQWKIVG